MRLTEMMWRVVCRTPWWAVTVVLFGLSSGGCDETKNRPTHASVTSAEGLRGEAPDFRFKRIDGSSARLRDTEGIRLIHFWATWCKPCVEELPKLLNFGEANERVTVLAVSIDTNWSVIRNFFDGDVPAGVVLPEVNVDRAYRVQDLPMTYVVDRRGEIVKRLVGARDWDSEKVRADVLSTSVSSGP